MAKRKIKYCALAGVIFLVPECASAQATGSPILNVTFGEGFATIGPPLPSINTTINYSNESCPPPGYYTITNNFYNCPANRTWRSLDHTSTSNPFATKPGYAMLVNDTASSGRRILYIDTLKAALCAGTAYQFSAWLINMEIPAPCNADRFPGFTFNVETTTGQILQSGFYGPLGYDYSPPPGLSPKFHFFGINFIMPPAVNGLVLKIFDESPGFAPCGYSYAIDDIQFAPVGPAIQMAFADGIGTDLVKGVCFQDNKTISFKGNMDAFYLAPSLQWQTSTDSGVTWVDVAGATKDSLSLTFSTPDTFLIRLTGADASTIANPNCRVASNYVTVQVDGLPSGYKITSNSPLCAGGRLQFNATGGASYLWWGPNGFSDNIAFPAINNAVLKDSGIYYTEIFSFGGCHKVDSLKVKIIGTDVNVSPKDTAICLGNTVKLKATKGTSYVWSAANGLSSTTGFDPIAAPTATTIYTVKVTDSYGCSDTASATISILNSEAVKAIINAADYLCPVVDSVRFLDNSLGKITNWYWDFGNGQSSIVQSPPVQYYQVNAYNYLAKLMVSDAAGCRDSATHILYVEDNCYIAVPNAFTPNGDGLNDYLYPINAYKATNLVFNVYNRMGQLVFTAKERNVKWDGRFGGLDQPAGAYVWTMEYIDATGKKVFLKGTTILIR